MTQYIGIPFEDKQASFDSCDCFGLVRLFYKNEFGIDIKAPQSSAFDSKATFAEFLYEISKNWISCDKHDYCVVGMANDLRIPTIVQHFGIILPNDKILHTLEKVGSHISDIKLYEQRIRGYYKWRT